LSASFNNLLQSVNGTSTSSSTGSRGSGTASSSNQSLTSFLNNLLQTVQSNGGHAIGTLGGNVNAKV
jgi:hypothetical protein